MIIQETESMSAEERLAIRNSNFQYLNELEPGEIKPEFVELARQVREDAASAQESAQSAAESAASLTIDQAYNSKSENAQSGKAVAEGFSSELSEVKGRTYQLFNKDNYDLLNFYYKSGEKKIINHNSGRAIIIPTQVLKDSRYVAEALADFSDIYQNISAVYFMSFADEPVENSEPLDVGTLKGQNSSRIFATIETKANANFLLFAINFKTTSNENTAMAEKVFQTMTVAQIDGGFPLPKPYYDFSALRLIPEITFLVSENLATSSNTNAGKGWSGTFDDGFAHADGNTGVITVNFGTLRKCTYLVEFDYTGNIDLFGFTAEMGGSYPVDVYNGTSHVIIGFQTDNTNPLVLTPFSSYVGTVTNISCREIISTGTDEVTISLDNFRYADCANEITGFWNIAVGKNALEKNVNGSRNIALGKSSLSMLLSGTRNLAYGTYSLPQLKNGNGNIGIGADAGLYMQTAEESVLIGKAAGGKLHSSQKDIAIGRCALYGADKDTSAPSQNIAIGENAGYNVTAANQNILIGKNAGYHISTGWRNIVIGNNAIATNLKTSQDIILIGAGTNLLSDGFTKSTAIGFQAVITKSNQTVIGGSNNEETVIYGKILSKNGNVEKEVAYKPDVDAKQDKFMDVEEGQGGAWYGEVDKGLYVDATNSSSKHGALAVTPDVSVLGAQGDVRLVAHYDTPQYAPTIDNGECTFLEVKDGLIHVGGNSDLGGEHSVNIRGVGTPIANDDAANKAYVDTLFNSIVNGDEVNY